METKLPLSSSSPQSQLALKFSAFNCTNIYWADTMGQPWTCLRLAPSKWMDSEQRLAELHCSAVCVTCDMDLGWLPGALWPLSLSWLLPTLSGLTVSSLHTNLQEANFQRCKHASGSSKEPEPVPSMSGLSSAAARPAPAVAEGPSALSSPTFSPFSSQQLFLPTHVMPAPVCQLS